MENQFLNGLKQATNYTYTKNGAITHKSTLDSLYDLFALGGAYRNRSDEDVIVLFQEAFQRDPLNALKCLFYLRDVRGGQGERRFFRVAIKNLAKTHPTVVRKNLELIPEYGRWDDLYALINTPVENDVFKLFEKQLMLDMDCKTPSLLAKWLKSENASSVSTRALGKLTRQKLHITAREYRKMLSKLRKRINVLERLMSLNQWEKIEFDKIPSKAGLIYKNAFAKRDILKARYEAFAKDENTTVNAGALYPYEVVKKALGNTSWWNNYDNSMSETDRAIIEKYWNNLTDYFKGASFNGMAVVDTSGSMSGDPINVAISLGLYCADKATGPFHNHYISFSSKPQLIQIKGVDFVDKVNRIYKTNLCDNTDIEATFDLVLSVAQKNHLSQNELPQNLIVISDMEFDRARHPFGYCYSKSIKTLMEDISQKWTYAGYRMPNLIFWNVNARHDNIPMKTQEGVTFVSGFSPVLFEQIMQGKTSYDLMFDKLQSDRYKPITLA